MHMVSVGVGAWHLRVRGAHRHDSEHEYRGGPWVYVLYYVGINYVREGMRAAAVLAATPSCINARPPRVTVSCNRRVLA